MCFYDQHVSSIAQPSNKKSKMGLYFIINIGMFNISLSFNIEAVNTKQMVSNVWYTILAETNISTS